MIWNYLTVLSLGILLGWRISRMVGQVSTAAKSSSNPAQPLSVAPVPDATPAVAPAPPVPATYPTPIDAPADAADEAPSPVSTIAKPTSTDEAPSPVNAVANPTSTSNDAQPLQLAYEMAHHLGQYKAGFLARTSHELRSPLNRVMSLQQLILADLCDSPEEERDFIRQSYEAAQELLELLNQTTTISKLEHGTTKLSPEPLSLIKILAELDMQTRLHAQNRNLKLSIEQPNSDIEVLADPRWLRQVLINLVTIPIYAMDEGHIDVTHHIDTEARTVAIHIQDERPASAWSEPMRLIEDGLAETLLNVAQSAPPNQQEPRQPSSAWGLSLITTTRLVETMEGTLDILSTPNSEGDKTLIQVTIPLAETA